MAGRNCPAIFLVVYLFLSLYSVVTYFKSGFLLLITPLARYAHGCSYFWSSLFKISSSADHFRTSICQVRIHRVGVRVLLQGLFIVSNSIAPLSAASQCINNLSWLTPMHSFERSFFGDETAMTLRELYFASSVLAFTDLVGGRWLRMFSLFITFNPRSCPNGSSAWPLEWSLWNLMTCPKDIELCSRCF